MSLLTGAIGNLLTDASATPQLEDPLVPSRKHKDKKDKKHKDKDKKSHKYKDKKARKSREPGDRLDRAIAARVGGTAGADALPHAGESDPESGEIMAKAALSDDAAGPYSQVAAQHVPEKGSHDVADAVVRSLSPQAEALPCPRASTAPDKGHPSPTRVAAELPRPAAEVLEPLAAEPPAETHITGASGGVQHTEHELGACRINLAENHEHSTARQRSTSKSRNAAVPDDRSRVGDGNRDKQHLREQESTRNRDRQRTDGSRCRRSTSAERRRERDHRHRSRSRDRRKDKDDQLRSRDRGRKRSRSRDRHREATRKRSKSLENNADADALVAKIEAAMEGGQDEEDRLIEERRRRRQEILNKHNAGPAVLGIMGGVPAASTNGGVLPSASGVQSQDPSVMGGTHITPSVGAPDLTAEQDEQPAGLPMPARGQPMTPFAPSDDDGALQQGNAQHRSPHQQLAPVGSTHSRESSPALSDQEDQQLDEASMWQQGATAAVAAGDLAATVRMEPEDRQERERELRRRLTLEGGRTASPMDIGAAPATEHDVDDMFAEADAEGRAGGEEDEGDMFADTPDRAALQGKSRATAKRGLQDAYDDPEGYYNFQVGEIMDKRYEVYANLGRGVFSSVLRARDTGAMDVSTSSSDRAEVAIKVLRANDTMHKAGLLEISICNKIARADPEGRRHCVRMWDSFEYRGHLCLVFEPMDMNLRELTKKYGRGVGLNVEAVRIYTAQLLQALYHLRNCGVVHADLKPDNILVNKGRNTVKVCDFGNAMFDGPDNEYTPYIGSRFYRSPEVILGLRYGFPLDVWATACVVYELFTGKILFPGKSNNEMLKRMMDVKGAFPRKMLKQGRFVNQHFEGAPNYAFAALEEDAVTKKTVRRMISNPVATKDFSKLLANSEGSRKKVVQLIDLLEKMTVLDPDKRITPKEALRHPFIKEH